MSPLRDLKSPRSCKELILVSAANHSMQLSKTSQEPGKETYMAAVLAEEIPVAN
jgi:hypothetical protein